jgi:uncharacterized membrane protein
MAGIGIKLNRIFQKHTLTSNLIGIGYSSSLTIAPMILIVAVLYLMQTQLGFSKTGYAQRELYTCTVLYMFAFSLIATAPFGGVLSRYISDTVYEERYEDVLPSYYVGLLMTMVFGGIFAIPFCIHEYIVGGVDISFVFAGYCGFMVMILVFFSMQYLAICKAYQYITIFFAIGMGMVFLTAAFLSKVVKVELTLSMLLGLDFGLLLIAAMEHAMVRCYFTKNSGRYKEVLHYFRIYWQIALANFCYMLGLYIHNMIFWTSDMRMVVCNSFVCATPYDTATCLAMFTNISSSVIFIARVEMNFNSRYKAYSEAVIGGRGLHIETAKRRMFMQVSDELMNQTMTQFIITIAIYFLCSVFLPVYGTGGMVMLIYPCLVVGYYIVFMMYACIIFLHYFNDLKGALMACAVFVSVSVLGTLVAIHLPTIWNGMGLVAGGLAGWCIAYSRLRWVERNLDVHVFCRGSILKKGYGERPKDQVYAAKPVLKNEE